MPQITLAFPSPINVSVQVGDVAYYTNDPNGVNIVLIGNITAVTINSITVNILTSAVRPTTSSFILFSKDNETNVNALTGYYAEVQLRNDSTTKSEMYSIASEVFESSK
jgi:hypothetical protein